MRFGEGARFHNQNTKATWLPKNAVATCPSPQKKSSVACASFTGALYDTLMAFVTIYIVACQLGGNSDESASIAEELVSDKGVGRAGTRESCE